LVLPNVPRAQAIGRAPEMSSESFDLANVIPCGSLRVITTLEFLQHDSAKMGHMDLLVTHNLSEGDDHHCGPHPRGSVRRASGFVLTGKQEVIPR